MGSGWIFIALPCKEQDYRGPDLLYVVMVVCFLSLVSEYYSKSKRKHRHQTCEKQKIIMEVTIKNV